MQKTSISDNQPLQTNIIEDFYTSFIERLSVVYQDEVWERLENLPSPIISFNNVEILKRAQLYVRHTDRLFGKHLAYLFYYLFEDKGVAAKCVADNMGKCLFVKQLNSRFHFFPLERFAGFPNVPWYKSLKQSLNSSNKDILDIYIVLIKNDQQGIEYVQSLNNHLCINNNAQRFFTIESFVRSLLGDEIWDEISDAFINIQHAADQYQWFELSNVCNYSNMQLFEKEVVQTIFQFNYAKEMEETTLHIGSDSFSLIGKEFFKYGYNLLFAYNDVKKSLLTSEWLFQNHKKDNNLDKTYIIAGYVKSVEQLLYHIISSLNPNHSISLTNYKTKEKENVPVNSEALFNATLGNMVYFLKDVQNRDIYIEGLNSEVIQCIISIINRWVYKERNGYFHKHLLCDMRKVYTIRNRTFLLYYLILGGIRNRVAEGKNTISTPC